MLFDPSSTIMVYIRVPWSLTKTVSLAKIHFQHIAGLLVEIPHPLLYVLHKLYVPLSIVKCITYRVYSRWEIYIFYLNSCMIKWDLPSSDFPTWFIFVQIVVGTIHYSFTPPLWQPWNTHLFGYSLNRGDYRRLEGIEVEFVPQSPIIHSVWWNRTNPQEV